MKNKIIYVSQAVFPFNAPGLRVHRVAEVLKDLDFDIIFVSTFCYRSSTDVLNKMYEPTCVSEDKDSFSFCANNNVYYCRKQSTRFEALKGTLEMFFAFKTFQVIQYICKKEQPYGVILYNDFGPLTKKLIPYCAKHKIKIFADVTEWYEKKIKINNLADFFVPRMVDYRIRKIDRKLNGVISISNYLHEHYQKVGVKSVCIPPLMPINYDYIPAYGKQIPVLVYAGSPGEKDLLQPAIMAVSQLNNSETLARFIIIGVDEAYITQEYGISNLQSKGIEALGRISHEKVIDILHIADYSFLLRRNLRYAKAGFSTKLSESLSMGTPVICNSIGGSDNIIKDGFNGFVISDASESQILDCLSKIVNLSIEQRYKMRKNAFKSSDFFDANNYRSKLKDLLG